MNGNWVGGVWVRRAAVVLAVCLLTTCGWAQITVRDGLGREIDESWLSDRVEANWNHLAVASLAYYMMAVGTTPGGTDVMPYTKIGSANLASPALTLASGTTYYTSIRAYDHVDVLQNTGTSNGFRVRGDPFFVDTASAGFFQNARALVMCDTTTTPTSVQPALFSNAGGDYWKRRVKVTITEPGVMDRVQAPCHVTFTVGAGEITNTRQIRVCDNFGNELPRYILTIAPNASTLTQPHIVFLVNMRKDESQDFWIYWDNTSATDPGYPFVLNTDNISVFNYTPYYSRRLDVVGNEEVPYATQLGSSTSPNPNAVFEMESVANRGAVKDDSRSNQIMNLFPTDFYFFGAVQNAWWCWSNATLYITNTRWNSCGPADATHLTTNTRFPNGAICALFGDLRYNVEGFPARAGIWRDDLTNPTRRVFTYRNNGWAATEDIQIFQLIVYQTGDIGFKYDYLSPQLLTGSGGDPRPNPHRTVGVSACDNSRYLRSAPLPWGLGNAPTSYYQCMDAFRGYPNNGPVFAAAETPVGGWANVGNIDSMVFDSRSTNPTWSQLQYDVNCGANGRINFWARTGGTPTPDGTWSAWTNVVTATANGATGLTVPGNRYFQYRAIFQRNGNGAPQARLDEVRIVCGNISVESVNVGVASSVTQGQLTIPIGVKVKNNNLVPATVASLALTFSLGSYTQALVSPTLPIVLGSGVATDATFTVTVWDGSPVGTATINASVTATIAGPITLRDTDAQFPATWWVRKKANLIIDKAETIPTLVNKNVFGVWVRLHLSNDGETPYWFDGATLTFTLGDYNKTLVAPAVLPVMVPGPGSLVATFSVDILSTSPSGVAVISGTAEGRNAMSNQWVGTTAAVLTDSWTIQNPAVLAIDTIVASSPVFRGQTNAPVWVTVINTGEALAYWDSSTLNFTLGTYDAINPTTTFPQNLYGGLATTARYGIDIAPGTATGTAIIDADVDGRDSNTLWPISGTGAAYPGSWTILAEQVQTFKDPSFLYESISYNRPGVGNTWVYARAENLVPFKEYAVRWYDPGGVQVASTNPPLTADAAGRITRQYGLSPASPYGVWTVKVTNPLNTFTNCLSNFSVVSGASLTCSLSLPTTVSVGQPFGASMTFNNPGGATLDSAYPTPSRLATSGTGIATWTSGPTPLILNVAGNSQATISWAWRATTPGSFTAAAKGAGFDANSDDFLQSATATSNMCTIQNPPNCSITAFAALPAQVYRNERGLVATVTVRNAGVAGAVVSAASLTFTLGSYSQYVANPILPVTIPGGGQRDFSFCIDVDSMSPTGTSTVSGNFMTCDANWPASTTYLTGGPTRTWCVNAAGIALSAEVTMTPEQYSFSAGQTVYFRAYGVPPNTQYYRMRVYPGQRAYSFAPPAGQIAWSSPLSAGGAGWCDFLYDIPLAPAIGTWSVFFCDNNYTFTRAVQYFSVQRRGALVATLTLSPTTAFVGDLVTATMIASNTVGSGSTIAPATASPLIKTAASTGDLTFLDGPTPAVATIAALSSGTFVWTYAAASDSGMVGSYSVVAELATGVTGVDLNTGLATASNQVRSNEIYIYRRGLQILTPPWNPPLWNLGTLLCGQTSAAVNSTVQNNGNYPLNLVSWNKTDLNGPGAKVSKANLTISPDPVGAIAAGGNKPASAYIWMPYNQPAGTYIATMAVYEDLNSNGNRETDEPYSMFAVQAVASLCQVLVWTDNYVDLGDWMPGDSTASKTVNGFNGGNLPCSSVTVKLLSGPAWIYANPVGPVPLATGETWIASVSAVVPALQPGGIYLATFTMFEDRNSDGICQNNEASSTFLVRIGVGTKGLVLAPPLLNIGTATPTYVLEGFPLTITNTGQLPLVMLRGNLATMSDGLGHEFGPENIAIHTPAVVGTGSAGVASVGIYIPAGQAVGTYTATQWVFEDTNPNGTYDSGEASASFVLRCYVPVWPAVQVLAGTVDVGGVAAGNTKPVSFPCRNIGNVTLSALYFEKVNLISGTSTINLAQYSFPPGQPIVPAATAGSIFYPNLQLTVPGGQADGNYVGSTAWLYNDMTVPMLARNAGEPQSNFFVTCQVGVQRIDILETSLSIVDAAPFTSATATFNLKNTGSLTLSNPTATGTALTLPPVLPASCSVFSPKPINYILPTQTKEVKWQFNVPANTAPGTYTGTLWAWEDADASGTIQATEASDSAVLQVNVASKKVLNPLQNPLNMGWTTASSTVQVQVEIVNVGNIPLTNVRLLASDVFSLSNSIASNNITFTPVTATINAVGGSGIATVTVTVPPLQPDGTYEGWLRVYDDYSPMNGGYNPGDEEFALFKVRISIGKKSFTMSTPNNLGNRNPGATYAQNMTLTNTSFVPLSRLRWSTGGMTDGVSTIPAANVTFAPVPVFACNGGVSRTCSATVNIPYYMPPSTYVGTYTVWEDDNNNTLREANEASAPFELRVTVNAVASVTFLGSLFDFGTVTQNGYKTGEIGFQNTGNVSITGLLGAPVWSTLWFVPGATASISSSLLSVVGMNPALVTPGPTSSMFGTLTVQIGPIAPLQTICNATEYYQGGPQTFTFTTATAGTANHSVNVRCRVLSGGPDIATGSVWQPLDATTLNPGRRYILSAWVCPASSPAMVGFITTGDPGAGEKVLQAYGVRIDPGGVVTGYASPTTSQPHRVGVVGVTRGEHASGTWKGLGQMTWYRVFVAFDNPFAPATASKAYVILQNQANASGSVWFDAVQLEPAVITNQDRPTTFTPGPTLVSPRDGYDLKGERYYYQW